MNAQEPTNTGIDRFAAGLADWTIRLRWLVILIAVLACGYIATGAQNLSFSNNYRAFFSKENPELTAFEDFQNTYTKNDNISFVIKTKDGSGAFTNDTLKAVAYLTEEGWQIPFSKRVDSLTNFQHTYADGDDLIVEDLVESPGDLSEEELARKKEIALAEPLLNGQIVTPDGLVTAINITLQYPEETLQEVPAAVEKARQMRSDVAAAYPNLEVYLVGVSMLNNAFSEASINDFGFLVPLMFVIILVTTAIAVRSITAMLSTLVIIILSCAAAMGVAGFVGIQLAGPSPSAPIVILTLAIADSIHILISMRGAMRDGMQKRDAIVEAIRINFLPVGVTSVTTMVGFMSLQFSDSPPFRDFGFITATGIFFAWMLSITLLPALLSLAPIRVKPREGGRDGQTFFGGFADAVVRYSTPLFIVTGLAVVALGSQIPTINLSDQWREYFAPRIEFRADSDAMIEDFGFYPIEFSIPAGEPGGVSNPDYLEKLEAYTVWLREQDGVRHVYSITDIMKRLNKNLNEDRAEEYRLPDDRELSAQYLLLYELSLPYGLDLNDRINIDKSASRVTATLDGRITTERVREFLTDTQDWFAENAPEIQGPPTGPQVMFTFIAQRNVESMVSGTAIAIAAIAVIMMIALRSFSMGLVSLVPNAMPIVAAFGAWALLVGEVGLSVAAIAAISLGIVIDDTVHFLTKYLRARREKGLSTPDSIRYAFETVGVAIVVNTVILAAGFLVLTASAFKINAEMGLLTALTIGLALVLDFLFLPALLLLISRDRAGASAPAKGETYA
ncbi:MAG: MMPL family transporter [Pseudomonadota bacterium]